MKDGLALPPSNRGRGRTAFPADAVEGLIVSGKWSTPKAGDEVKIGDRTIGTWKAINAGDDGTFRDPALRGGYLSVNVPSDEDRVMILEASGHSMVYAGGEPRAGDPYSNGSLHLPVKLRKGDNEFLFSVGRGMLKARLVPPKKWAYLDLADTTLPDLVVGQAVDAWIGVVLVNANEGPGIPSVRASFDGNEPFQPSASIPPLSARKIAVHVEGPATDAEGPRKLTLDPWLRRGTDGARLRVRRPQRTPLHGDAERDVPERDRWLGPVLRLRAREAGSGLEGPKGRADPVPAPWGWGRRGRSGSRLFAQSRPARRRAPRTAGPMDSTGKIGAG